MSVAQGTLEVVADTQNTEAAGLIDAMPPRIQVHNGDFTMVAKGFGKLNEKFDPGLYLVRVELGDKPFEQVVRVAADGVAKITYPASSQPSSSSAAVVEGTSSLHEYTGDYTRALSRTKAELVLGSGARLVVLATRQSPGDAAPIRFKRVRLLDNTGKCIADLARRSAVAGPTNPDLARGFAAEVNPGGLVLEWTEDARDAVWRQPLWIPHGYVMLVFVTVPSGKTEPDMASPSIHLARLSVGFEPQDGFGPAAEAALESLKTGRQLLSQARLIDLLQGKFHNPMLGIYGGHMILQRSMPDSEKIVILEEVLRNLDSLLTDSPDVAALRLLLSQLKGTTPSPPTACAWPPMIRLGYLAFRHADWDHPGVFIKNDSLADRIRTQLGLAGIWSKWAAERRSNAEFRNADAGYLMKVIKGRLSQVAKARGGAAASTAAERSIHTKRPAGSVIIEEPLSPAPAGFTFRAFPAQGDAPDDVESMLNEPPEIDPILGESLACLGLNKQQARDVTNRLNLL